MIETLTRPDPVYAVLDGQKPHAFTRVNHTSVGCNAAAARQLPALIRQCLDARATRATGVTLPDGQDLHVMAIPVPGPSGQVHAVEVWAGVGVDTFPMPPKAGGIEWNRSGVMTSTPAAQYLLGLSYDDPASVQIVPELLAGCDHWHDRTGFLDLFNLGTPSSRWSGTVTKTVDGVQHHLFVAARARGIGADRTVRAVVCEMTGPHTALNPDPCSIALRHMPIPAGHALGLVDLKSGFVHEWLTEVHSPLAGWGHHNPEFDYDSWVLVATTVFELDSGVRDTADIVVRLRFDPAADWITVRAYWKRISGGGHPQALLDVTPAAQTPTPVVSSCRVCQDLARRASERILADG